MEKLHHLLENSARSHPQRVAVEDPERKVQLSYEELNTLADGVKEKLLALGVAAGDRVGICAPKSIGTVAALFGALKAGAAYVPVGPDAPAQRHAYIFANCSVKAVVVARALLAGLQAEFSGVVAVVAELRELSPLGADLLLVEVVSQDQAEPAPEIPNLSYILYTSGSTGQPKGVIHTHSSALSFINWCSEAFAPTPEDRFSSHAPFHFDLSILDIYVPLKHGGTLVLIGEDLGKQPARLGPVIAERRISVWYSTPSILRLLVEHGRLDQHDYSALRLVFFAGEVFPIKHLRALRAIWPHPRYVNLYGPTETNVCTYYEVPTPFPDDRTEPFPIGRVCSDDLGKVMDENDAEVPFGHEGELYICGGSVMVGYWNLPERNAKAFYTDSDGRCWHRTGDVVRQEANGDYLFIGRRDRMVKRRGYRVELGEIESALYRHPSIAEAAVIALPDSEGGVSIKAFLSWTGEKPASQIALKQFCAQNLPLYMIPDRFSVHPSLPKTSTDKIDYQKLKELE